MSGQRLGAVTVVASVALALVATALVYGRGVGLPWSEAGGPEYCWGAWEGENVPWHTNTDPDDIKVTKDAPPTAESPTGVCAYLFGRDDNADNADNAEGASSPQYTGSITVTYDRFPERAEDRLPWLTRYFDGTAAPLPGGLPGFVNGERGMLVLPPRCDEDYEPTVLTLTTNTRSDLSSPLPGGAGATAPRGRSDIAKLLLSAARKGVEHAGCTEPAHADDTSEVRPAEGLDRSYDDRRYEGEDGYDPGRRGDQDDEHPFRVDSPVLGIPESATGTRGSLCGLTGTRESETVLGPAGNRHEWSWGWGVPGARSHVCSYHAVFDQPDMATDSHGMDRQKTDGLALTATSDERLVELLLDAIQRDDHEELPGWGDTTTYGAEGLAVARARCSAGAGDPQDTLFMVVRSHPTKLSPAQVLPEYVSAVEKHLGCVGLAPSD